MRLLLFNPNTNAGTTEAMRAIAEEEDASATIVARTAPYGSPIITNEEELAVAARAVAAGCAAASAERWDGCIIAAFGDPGLGEVRRLFTAPVTGLAEAGMLAAADRGRRFCVVTTTPELVMRIAGTAWAYGIGPLFTRVHLTPGDPHAVMANEERLFAALLAACREACDAGEAEAIVIGGGPLARAARRLRGLVPLPIIEPLPAAIHLARARAEGRAAPSAV